MCFVVDYASKILYIVGRYKYIMLKSILHILLHYIQPIHRTQAARTHTKTKGHTNHLHISIFFSFSLNILTDANVIFRSPRRGPVVAIAEAIKCLAQYYFLSSRTRFV